MNAHQVKVRLTGQPDSYIDCGKKIINTDGTVITVVNARRNYSYTAYQHIHLDTFTFNNTFTGYASLIVIGDKTSSKIMVQYELELQTDEKKTSTRGQKFYADRHEKLQLNSNTSKHSTLFNATCRSTGNLERKIVDIMTLMPGMDSSKNKGVSANRW